MNELDALRLIRDDGRKSLDREPAAEPEERKPLSTPVLLTIIIVGYLLSFVLIYFATFNPFERTLIKMAVLKNYTVTVSTNGETTETVVDGRFSYSDGVYYETVDGTTYRYYVDENGRWQKKHYAGGSSGNILISTLLNKENYKFKLIPIGRYTLRDGLKPDGMENVVAWFTFGRFNASGQIIKHYSNVTYYFNVHIQIHKFGKSNIDKPVVGERAR